MLLQLLQGGGDGAVPPELPVAVWLTLTQTAELAQEALALALACSTGTLWVLKQRQAGAGRCEAPGAPDGLTGLLGSKTQ